MNRLGVETGLDLRRQSLEILERHFGKAGAYFYSIARGVDERPVQANRLRKSLGAENTFSEDIFTFDAAQAALAPLLEKVWRAGQNAGLSARTVTLKVKFSDFRLITRARTSAAGLRSRQEFEALAFSLLATVFPAPRGVRLLGVTLSSFDSDPLAAEASQLRLSI